MSSDTPIQTDVRNKMMARNRRAMSIALLLWGFILASQARAQIQIVNCNAQIQSPKRGIPVNTMSAADFQAVAPGVSWYYDWGTTPLTVPNGVAIKFVPMVWNGSSGFLTGSTGLSNY